MITITPAAAEQIKLSVEQSEADGLPLRIAATLNDDNTIHYAMGFDEAKEEDTAIQSGEINIIISPISEQLLKDTTLDYVELQPGQFQFIFMNPNDPEYVPPSE